MFITRLITQSGNNRDQKRYNTQILRKILLASNNDRREKLDSTAED